MPNSHCPDLLKRQNSCLTWKIQGYVTLKVKSFDEFDLNLDLVEISHFCFVLPHIPGKKVGQQWASGDKQFVRSASTNEKLCFSMHL